MNEDRPLSLKSTNGRSLESDEPLATSAPLMIRPIRPSDSIGLQHAFDHDFSANSRYLRFHTPLRNLSDVMVHYLTHVDGIDHVALVAIEFAPGQPVNGVGVARFVRDTNDPGAAELAAAVVDHAQGRGIGRRLLEALARAAHARGIERFHMDVLSNNRKVVSWALRLGAISGAMQGGVATYQLPVAALLTSSDNNPRSSAA